MSKYISILSLLMLLNSCSLFNQNDFIATENITQIDKEKFIYSVYQTGIDNYRVEFIVIVDIDTIKLFDYGINDAVYSKEHSFQFKTSQDTLVIITPHQISKFYYKSPNGVPIEVTK